MYVFKIKVSGKRLKMQDMSFLLSYGCKMAATRSSVKSKYD